MRAANGFTVWLSWICLAFRVGQLAAAAIKSEKAAWVVYAALTFIMVLMFFSEMITEGADIVHEAEPTEQAKRNAQIFAKNYDNPYGTL
jgi:TRAP-type C4-dicarboxylate transport system permease small subunit